MIYFSDFGAASAPLRSMEPVQVALRTTTGSQTITLPTGYGTPTGAIFLLSNATVNDTETTLGQSFGASDGTNSWVKAVTCIGGSDGTYKSEPNYIGGLQRRSDFAWIVRFSLTSFGSDTITINVDTTDGGARLLTIFPFKTNFAVGTAKYDTSAQTCTPNFPAQVVFVTHYGGTASSSTVEVNLGVATWDGVSVRQGSWGHGFNTPGGTQQNVGQVRNDKCLTAYNSSTNFAQVSASLFDATTFKLTSTASFTGNQIGWIAIGGLTNAWCGIIDSPTSTGIQSLTDGSVGFTPTMGMLFPTQMPAVNTQYTDGNAGAMGYSAFTANAAYSHWFRERDNISPTSNGVTVSNSPMGLDFHAGAACFRTSTPAFVSNGAQLNFTTTDATARKILALYMK